MKRAFQHGQELRNRERVVSLFSLAIEKCKEMENPNLAIRFMLKMGDASMTAALGILNMLDEQSREELLCGLTNLHCLEIQSALNALLQKDELGKNICIGDIYMEKNSIGQMLFVVRNIRVNYAGLAANDTVKQKIGDYANQAVKNSIFSGIGLLQKVAADGVGLVAEIAARAAPEMTEKVILSFMNKEENRRKLLQMAEGVLKEKGLYLKWEDLVFVQEDIYDLQSDPAAGAAKESILPERKSGLSPELVEGLMEAVAEYLKMLV